MHPNQVAKERPDLEETKNNLIIQNAKMASQLKDIESTILKLLSESQVTPPYTHLHPLNCAR